MFLYTPIIIKLKGYMLNFQCESGYEIVFFHRAIRQDL